MQGDHPDHQALLRHVAENWSTFGPMSASDVAAVRLLDVNERVYVRNADLTPPSETPAFPQVVTSGLVCQMRAHPTRRRQIFGFVLPGEIVGSFWRRPEFNFYRTVALTRTKTVSAAPLLAVDEGGAFRHPALVEAARRAEDHTQHFLFNHIVRLGQRDAYSGLAHLLVELHERLSRVGMARDGELLLPFSQRVLAQAMGFSVAHTNHTLQRMAADGLFEMRGERIRLLAPDRMAALADFTADGALSQTQTEPPDAFARPPLAMGRLPDKGLQREGAPGNDLNHQPNIDGDDGRGEGVAAYLYPCPVGERPHEPAVAGEHHQGYNSEPEL